MLTRGQKRKVDVLTEPGYVARGKIRKLNEMKIVSWNMQGVGAGVGKAGFLRNLMRQDGVVAICLQECGNLFNWTNQDLDAGWTIAVHRQWNAGGGNNRCSLAILTSAMVLGTHEIGALLPTQRPVVGARINNRWVYSVHAPAGGNANYVRDALVSVRGWAAGESWIVAGDMNLAPGVVAPPRDTAPANCGQATHQNGNEIDYAYAGGHWRADWAAARMGNRGSDHWPVAFTISGGNWRR